MAMNRIRVFILSFLLLAPPFLQVAQCQSDAEPGAAEFSEEGGEIGVVGEGEDVDPFIVNSFGPAPGVDTICVFPKNGARLVPAGEESELLVGMKNDGELNVNIIAIKASIHLPMDHRYLLQNLTAQLLGVDEIVYTASHDCMLGCANPLGYLVLSLQWMAHALEMGFNNASVPPSTQATFPYMFAVSRYLQPGNFDLAGTIIYEIDQQPYQSIFFNGTIEVIEAGGFLSIESVFLFALGIALLVLLGLWVHGRLQQLSKKTKKAPKVEVGTRSVDSNLDEWLQGTAYTQPNANKSKKKK